METKAQQYEARAIAALNDGFTTKTAQKGALDYVNRAYDALQDSIKDAVRDIPREQRTTEQDHVYWAIPMYPHQWKHSAMVLAVFPELSDTVAKIESLKALRDQIKNTPVVNVAKEAKAAAKAAAEARSIVNPIAAVINPMRDEAVTRSEAAARKSLIEFAEALLNTDLAVTAAYPKSNIGRAAYQKQQAVYSMSRRLLECAQKENFRDKTELAISIRHDAIDRLVTQAGEDAAAQFDAYVFKLTEKVGECVSATVDGKLWNYSVLTVTKADGTVERWKTQQILNVSVLGKLFNQWPTRLMK